MSELNEQAPARRRNPLTWIAIIVIGLILFVFLGGDRRDVSVPDKVEDSPVVETVGSSEGSIERSLLLPPGMRAREYIEQIRAAGKPYPLAQVHDKAQDFQHEGSLADAHLLYFFAARENHLPAMMVMAHCPIQLCFRPRIHYSMRPMPYRPSSGTARRPNWDSRLPPRVSASYANGRKMPRLRVIRKPGSCCLIFNRASQ